MVGGGFDINLRLTDSMEWFLQIYLENSPLPPYLSVSVPVCSMSCVLRAHDRIGMIVVFVYVK